MARAERVYDVLVRRGTRKAKPRPLPDVTITRVALLVGTLADPDTALDWDQSWSVYARSPEALEYVRERIAECLRGLDGTIIKKPPPAVKPSGVK